MVDHDPQKTVALALAADICRGCVCHDPGKYPCATGYAEAPCPFFHPDNFYYDSQMKRFWCRNWMDAAGNDRPSADA